MVMKYYTFVQNILKEYIKVFYQLDLFLSNEIIHQSLRVNASAILQIFITRAIKKRSFIFYNNINFYKKV